jgi:hypothetical protein
MQDVDAKAISVFLAVASLAAKDRNLPFAPDKRIWGEQEIPAQIEKLCFVRNVRQHKLIRSVYASVQANPPAFISSDTVELLRQKALVEAAIKQQLFVKIKRLQEVFLSYGKEFLVVKGPASSFQLYGDRMLRGYLDLDIIVDLEDFQQVVPLMQEAGYSLKEGQVLDVAEKWVIQKTRHAIFTTEGSPYRIEVHTSLFDRLDSSYSASALFARSVSIPFGEYSVRTLCLADHALFILEHGTHHYWSLLHWLLDAAKILQIDDTGFHSEYAKQVRITGQEKKMAFMIELVTSLFPVAVPAPYVPIVARYQGHFSKQFNYSCRQLATAAGKQAQSIRERISLFYRFQIELAAKVRDKLRLSASLFLVPPSDAKAVPLPSFLEPLHLLLRPFFVIERRIKRLIVQKAKGSM